MACFAHWCDNARHIGIVDFEVADLDREDPAEVVENWHYSVRNTAPRSHPDENIDLDLDLAIAHFHGFSPEAVRVLNLGRTHCGSAGIRCAANSPGCMSLVHVHPLAIAADHSCHHIGIVASHFVANVGRRTDFQPSS